MKKGFIGILTAILGFLSVISNTIAAPSSVSYFRRDLQNTTMQSAASAYHQSVTSGGTTYYTYSVNKSLSVPYSGVTLTYRQELSSAGYAAILGNGYGGSWGTHIMGSNFTNDQKYYITQLALWIYQGSVSTSSLNQNDSLVAAAIKLSNAAKTATKVTPKISQDINSSTMAVEGSYYRSQLVTVSGAGYDKYTVTLINAGADAEIVTSAGQVLKSGASLTASTKFYIRIPTSKVTTAMTPIIKVSAVAPETKVYQYTTNNSSYSDMIFSEVVSTTVTNQINLTLPYQQKATAVISKKDTTTNKELAGATLQLKDANGRVVDSWVSTTTPRTIRDLTPGRYTLTELYAPSGYMLNTEAINFVLSAGESRSITMYNTTAQVSTAVLYANTVDSSTNRNIAGVTMQLKNSRGTVVETWTSTTSTKAITNLAPGTYTLVQTSVPSGYVLNTQVNSVTLTAGKSTNAYSYVSPVSQKGTAIITNKDNSTKNNIAGATLQLKDSSGKVIETWTSTTAAKTISNLTPGTYTLIQTKAPAGYTLNTNQVKFTVKAGETQNASMYNDQKVLSINIQILDNATKKPIIGAKLTVKDMDGKVVDTWTSTSSARNIRNLQPGAYSITQTSTPNGYVTSTTPVNFTITNDSDPNRVISVYSNPEVMPNTVKISVTDISTGKQLSGAKMTLKDSTGKVVDSWTSTGSAHAVALEQGTYTLVQTKAPNGYGLSEEVIVFTVDANGNANKSLVMYNSKIPATADISLVTVYAGFMGTIALGLFGMFKLSKQH